MGAVIITPWGIVAPAATGRIAPIMAGAVGAFRLPTDPTGTTTVTFSGVNAGSEIRVFSPSGVEVAGVESCDANPSLTWATYPSGDANNDVTIRIIALAYEIIEFVYSSVRGTISIPIQQLPDPWYSNP